MDLSALFKITYGLFIVGVESDGKLNGCIINTAAQATAEPPKMIITMLKSNYTADLIRDKNSLSLSVLATDCHLDMFSLFGYKSGREINKFENVDYKVDAMGNPYLTKYVNAVISLSVEETIDLGTHWLFICPVENAKNVGEENSMTYGDYRILKSGGKIGKAADIKKADKKYVCSVCHYVYDEETPFEDLPDDYVCPICGVSKKLFVLE